MSTLRSRDPARAALREAEPAPAPRGNRDRLFFPFADDVPVVLVPGLRDSGPRHWQTLWQRAHPAFLRVVPRHGEIPDLDGWATETAMVLRSTVVPPLVVAHGYGGLAVVRAAFRDRLSLAGAMLVAPADPQRFEVEPLLPAVRLPYASMLVASTNDPWLRFTRAGHLAQRWGSRFVAVESGGHLDADSRLGAWPGGIALLRDLAERAAAGGVLGRIART